jgi:hypothetical protein
MSGHGSKFSRKKTAAIEALLNHQGNQQAAAQEVGLSSKTLSRWLKVPEFREEYNKALQEVFRHSTTRLIHAFPAAASTLLKVMVDPTAPAACRARAAAAVMNLAVKTMEMQDVDVRLSKLEIAEGLTGGGDEDEQ